MAKKKSQKQSAPEAKSMPVSQVIGGRQTPEEEVRFRAYEIFALRARDGVPGDPVSDWVQAEQELRAKQETIQP